MIEPSTATVAPTATFSQPSSSVSRRSRDTCYQPRNFAGMPSSEGRGGGPIWCWREAVPFRRRVEQHVALAFEPATGLFGTNE
jgi:hypothetical protein